MARSRSASPTRQNIELQAIYSVAAAELEPFFKEWEEECHPRLHEDAQWLMAQHMADDVFETGERGHGREQVRRAEVWREVSYLDPHGWPGLLSVARITATRTVKGVTSEETRVYLCSLTADAERLLEVVRAHWEVENKPHWVLDVVFGEDGHTYAKGHGPENMAVLRQLALNLLRREPDKAALKRKRKRAAMRTSIVPLFSTSSLNPDVRQPCHSPSLPTPRGGREEYAALGTSDGWIVGVL